MTARVRTLDLGEISLSVTTQGEGPSVLLLHGFPEIAYSWRHQIGSLAEAGHHVIAPDQRGYGWSDRPETVEAYDIAALVGDAVALLDHFEVDRAFVAGHDWGSIVAWHLALLRPDRVKGLALLSVPYVPRGGRSVTDHIAATDPDGPFSYILAFQEPGLVESILDADPIGTLRSAHWRNSGLWPDDADDTTSIPDGLPPHLSLAEMENYGRAFARSGFGGGINWYRNFDRNWGITRPWHEAKIRVPTCFIAGAKDFLVTRGNGGLGARYEDMDRNCVDHRGSTLIEGAGHWVQQEAPHQVTDRLLAFFAACEG